MRFINLVFLDHRKFYVCGFLPPDITRCTPCIREVTLKQHSYSVATAEYSSKRIVSIFVDWLAGKSQLASSVQLKGKVTASTVKYRKRREGTLTLRDRTHSHFAVRSNLV